MRGKCARSLRPQRGRSSALPARLPVCPPFARIACSPPFAPCPSPLWPSTELKEGALGTRSPSTPSFPDRSATPTPPHTSMNGQGSTSNSQLGPGPSSSSSSSSPTNSPLASSTGAPIPRSGLLTIRVVDARGLALPQGVNTPPSIARALAQYGTAGSGAGTSFAQSFANTHGGGGGGGHPHRGSMQRKQCWWLPYIVLEFDKNEILIDALGGDIQGPVWMYKAHL